MSSSGYLHKQSVATAEENGCPVPPDNGHISQADKHFFVPLQETFFFFIFLRTFREIAVMKNELFPSFPFQAN